VLNNHSWSDNVKRRSMLMCRYPDANIFLLLALTLHADFSIEGGYLSLSFCLPTRHFVNAFEICTCEERVKFAMRTSCDDRN
jgi:hypothetical protein